MSTTPSPLPWAVALGTVSGRPTPNTIGTVTVCICDGNRHRPIRSWTGLDPSYARIYSQRLSGHLSIWKRRFFRAHLYEVLFKCIHSRTTSTVRSSKSCAALFTIETQKILGESPPSFLCDAKTNCERDSIMTDAMDVAIARQRKQLTKKRDDVQGKVSTLQTELAEIDRQFAAVQAYENTLAGKLPRSTASNNGSAKPGRRGEKQAQVLQVVGQHAAGMTRGELIEALDLVGNKAGAQSVSNALTALKKAGKIASADGKWQAAPGAAAEKGKRNRRRKTG
jgi:hypothetical protein